MTNQYAKVEPIINDDDQLEDVHLDVLGVKLDLPNLNSADLPIDLVNVILLIKSQPVLSDEQTALAMSAMLSSQKPRSSASSKENRWIGAKEPGTRAASSGVKRMLPATELSSRASPSSSNDSCR